MRRVFKFIDRSSDGWIDPDELCEALRQLGGNLTLQQVRLSGRARAGAGEGRSS